MVIPISEVKDGVFKIDSMSLNEDSTDKVSQFVECPDNFVLALRGADNSFHEVNSSVCNIIRKNSSLIKKGISLPSIASKITGSKDLKIKRYIIWKKDEEAFLVGEALNALRKVSEITN